MKKLLTIFALMLVAFTANAQSCPDNNHPHMIDLGLPSGTKWACCNVDDDASKQSPTNYGSYYAWGETEVKDVYNDVTYQYSTGVDEDGDGRYDDFHEDTFCYGVNMDLGCDIAGTKYNVAHVKWGGSWVMPSFDQIQELLDNCTYEWITVNGVDGGKFIGSNGGSIFLPAAGGRYGSDLYGAGSNGFYWSSTQSPSFASRAYDLRFYSGYTDCSSSRRSRGPIVRPVFRD